MAKNTGFTLGYELWSSKVCEWDLITWRKINFAPLFTIADWSFIHILYNTGSKFIPPGISSALKLRNGLRFKCKQWPAFGPGTVVRVLRIPFIFCFCFSMDADSVLSAVLFELMVMKNERTRISLMLNKNCKLVGTFLKKETI